MMLALRQGMYVPYIHTGVAVTDQGVEITGPKGYC